MTPKTSNYIVRIAAALAGCIWSAAVAQAQQSPQPYFLNWSQKGELIKSGAIEEQGQWYNVRLVPGYLPPARYSKDHWRAAGNRLGEYAEPEKWHDLAKTSRGAFRWGTRDAMGGYAIAGSAKAWGRYLSDAQDQTRRRVFGWWLAYPWAGFKGTVNTGWRYLAGTTGMASAYAAGLIGSPLYHTTDSLLIATLDASVNGVVLPASAATWNTAISPPLAMLGQRPSPRRVDGFWVTLIDNPYLGPQPLTEEQRREVLAFARHLDASWESVGSLGDEELSALQQAINELEKRLVALRAEHKAMARAQREQREAYLAERVSTWQAEHPESVVLVRGAEWLNRHQAGLNEMLRQEFEDRAGEIMQMLRGSAAVSVESRPQGNFGASTDPLRTAVGEAGGVVHEGRARD